MVGRLSVSLHCYHNQTPGVKVVVYNKVVDCNKVVECDKVVDYNKAVECSKVVVYENMEWVTTVSLSAKRREN